MSNPYRIVVNTEIKEDYDALMKLCEEARGEWKGGNKPTEQDHWERFEEETCIVISKRGGTIKLTYGNKEAPKSRGAISYQKFLTAGGLSALK